MITQKETIFVPKRIRKTLNKLSAKAYHGMWASFSHGSNILNIIAIIKEREKDPQYIPNKKVYKIYEARANGNQLEIKVTSEHHNVDDAYRAFDLVDRQQTIEESSDQYDN
jgi:hypothetical protein